MSRPSSNVQAVIEAVHALDEAKINHVHALDELAEVTAKLKHAEAAERTAEARLQELLRAEPASRPSAKVTYRLPEDLALCWRLGFLILESPKVDYASWGAKLWKENPPLDVVRNRLSTHLDRLKKLEVIVRDGDSYRVNSEKLAEHSKVPIVTQ